MKYRKKPVVIEAFRLGYEEPPSWYKGKPEWDLSRLEWSPWEIIETLEGKMRALKGDYIILGVKGECYPCKPDIFEMTYEKVNDPDNGEGE